MFKEKRLLFKRSLTAAMFFVMAIGLSPIVRSENLVDYKVVLKSGSKIEIEGNSTLHKYEAKTTELSLNADGKFKDDIIKSSSKKEQVLNTVIQAPAQRAFDLTIPVKTLQSGIPGLAPKIHKTLKQKEFPDIVFKMSDYEVKDNPAQVSTFLIKAKGVLTVAGQDKPITLDLTAKSTESGIHVTGQTQLLMTDFGVKPPVFVFIKAANEVLVKWDLILDTEESK